MSLKNDIAKAFAEAENTLSGNPGNKEDAKQKLVSVLEKAVQKEIKKQLHELITAILAPGSFSASGAVVTGGLSLTTYAENLRREKEELINEFPE